MNFKLLCVSMLSFCLLACSPSVQATIRADAIRTSAIQVVPVVQNSEVFVVSSGLVRAASRAQADAALDPLTPRRNPQKGQKFSAEVNWFKLRDGFSVNGIQLKLLNQIATREITDVGITTFSILDTLDLVFSVKVLSGVLAGIQLIVVPLKNLDVAENIGSSVIVLDVTPKGSKEP